MTVEHPYRSYGQYVVSVTAANYLSSDSDSLRITASNRDCNSPMLDIEDRAASFWQPHTELRKDRFSVIGETHLDCSATLVNDKWWSIDEVDPSTGKAIRSVDISGLEKTRYNSELSVPARYLDYGVYRFIFHVQMEDELTKHLFSNEVDTYVEVGMSELIPTFSHGSMSRITRGLGSVIVLEPEEHSLDPDEDPAGDQVSIQCDFSNHLYTHVQHTRST